VRHQLVDASYRWVEGGAGEAGALRRKEGKTSPERREALKAFDDAAAVQEDEWRAVSDRKHHGLAAGDVDPALVDWHRFVTLRRRQSRS
jgi:hypothetical protein